MFWSRACLKCGDTPCHDSGGLRDERSLVQIEVVSHGTDKYVFLECPAKDMRKPKTHVRMIHMHDLLKYEYLVDILFISLPTIHLEILDVYVEAPLLP